MSEMKVCKSCGGINEIESKRCKYCGNSLFMVKSNKFYLINKDENIKIVKDLFIERKDFSSQFISNKHAYLFVSDDKLYVRDLKSTNGTYLNNEKLEPLVDYELKNEDIIIFADLELKVGVDI